MKKLILLATVAAFLPMASFAWTATSTSSGTVHCCSKDQKTPCTIDLQSKPCIDKAQNSQVKAVTAILGNMGGVSYGVTLPFNGTLAAPVNAVR